MKDLRSRKAIVVVGMHRSGTSMAAGIFSMLGFNLGTRLIPGLDDNQKGFFENIPLNILNDRMLGVLGSSWHETYLIRKDWWAGKPLADFLDELVDIIKDQFSDSEFLLFKDPRLSILLPFYLEAFKLLGIQPCFIICYRNPSEVAASLLSRNQFPAEKSVLLWMDYMLNAEFHTRNFPRSFCFFNDLMQDPFPMIREVTGNIQYDLPSQELMEQKIHMFIERDLKHHNISGMPSGELYTPEITQLYQIVTNAEKGEFGVENSLAVDDINISFFNKMTFFQGMGNQILATLVFVHAEGKKGKITKEVLPGINSLTFDLTEFKAVREVKFVPANCRVGLIVQHVEVKDEGGNQTTIEEFCTGDDFYRTHYREHKIHELVFFTDNIVEITFGKSGLPEQIASISFQINYRVFGEGALKLNHDTASNLISSFYHERESILANLRIAESQLLDSGIKLQMLEEELIRQKQQLST